MTTSIAIAEKFKAIVGTDHVCPATSNDTVASVQPEYVVSPGTERELAAVLACANETGVAVTPRGGGTKLDWGNPPKRTAVVVSTLRLNRVLEHAWADLTVVVEAGCTMQALQSALAQQGQRLALDTLWPERATIGGVLSSNDSGVLRLRFGALRDLIIGVTLALPDGTLAKSGGKVVKNVAGYDLPKLATGALGTLGVITQAIFRLHPLCHDSMTLTFSAHSIEEMQSAILDVQNSQLAHTSLQVRCGAGHQPTADILFEATPAGLLAQETKLQELLRGLPVQQTDAEAWLAKQHLWDSSEPASVIAKLSILPSIIAAAIRQLEKLAASDNTDWRVVQQATGIGWLRLTGTTASMKPLVQEFRSYLENSGGSLVLLRRPPDMGSVDAWGNPGDAIGVMRALKQQLDPKAALNPGRFVGGI